MENKVEQISKSTKKSQNFHHLKFFTFMSNVDSAYRRA